MNKGLKITLIVALVLLYSACLFVTGWYVYIKFFGPQKLISNTYEVGLQELKDADNPDAKYFIEVNSMANMFEIKFNYMLDENQEAFYSQGLQFMADEYGKINFAYAETREDEVCHWNGKHFLSMVCNYDRFVDGYLAEGQYNYMSGNDYEDCLESTNPIGKDTFFKIQLGDKLYGMKFKGHNSGFLEKYGDYHYGVSGKLNDWSVNLYRCADYIYFAERLYNAVQTVANGKNKAMIFEFGDLFDYYEYDEEKQAYFTEPVAVDKVDSIIAEVKSYYSILVHKSESKVQKSSDSLFNCVRGVAGWNESEDYTTEDYFVGRTIIEVRNNNFDFVFVAATSYAAKLNNKFYQDYGNISDKVVLDIIIDLDSIDFDFVGFTADSGFDTFQVLRCRTAETIDGTIVYSEVEYA